MRACGPLQCMFALMVYAYLRICMFRYLECDFHVSNCVYFTVRDETRQLYEETKERTIPCSCFIHFTRYCACTPGIYIYIYVPLRPYVHVYRCMSATLYQRLPLVSSTGLYIHISGSLATPKRMEQPGARNSTAVCGMCLADEVALLISSRGSPARRPEICDVVRGRVPRGRFICPGTLPRPQLRHFC